MSHRVFREFSGAYEVFSSVSRSISGVIDHSPPQHRQLIHPIYQNPNLSTGGGSLEWMYAAFNGPQKAPAFGWPPVFQWDFIDQDPEEYR